MIYMTHPLHGAKYCALESEAQADEKTGWVRSTEPKAAAQEPQPQAAAQDDKPSITSAPEAAAPLKRGPGRPRRIW